MSFLAARSQAPDGKSAAEDTLRMPLCGASARYQEQAAEASEPEAELHHRDGAFFHSSLLEQDPHKLELAPAPAPAAEGQDGQHNSREGQDWASRSGAACLDHGVEAEHRRVQEGRQARRGEAVRMLHRPGGEDHQPGARRCVQAQKPEPGCSRG